MLDDYLRRGAKEKRERFYELLAEEDALKDLPGRFFQAREQLSRQEKPQEEVKR